jgi:predicted amidohydrolase YtcJ
MTPAASPHNLIQTGIFVDKAMDLINKLKPTPTEAETVECFETTMRDALRFGLTSIHDAAAHLRDIEFFQRHVLLPSVNLPFASK